MPLKPTIKKRITYCSTENQTKTNFNFKITIANCTLQVPLNKSATLEDMLCLTIINVLS